MTNKKEGVLYIGVTNNVFERARQHKEGLYEGFTKKYKLKCLVYYEYFEDINVAISREKQLKNWHRQWKINLINQENPEWKDLFGEMLRS